jgi:hypothetical protein
MLVATNSVTTHLALFGAATGKHIPRDSIFAVGAAQVFEFACTHVRERGIVTVDNQAFPEIRHANHPTRYET